MCKYIVDLIDNLFGKKDMFSITEQTNNTEQKQEENVQNNELFNNTEHNENNEQENVIVMIEEDILHVIVNRVEKGETYTKGKLYVEDTFVCDTLEDRDRGLHCDMSEEEIACIKVKSQTAIPTGEYELDLNVKSPKFSNFEKYTWAKKYDGKLPRFLSVKGYEGVLIHVGNKDTDTDGCLLVGKDNGTKGKIECSVMSFNKLMDEYLLPNKEKKIMIKIQ